MGADEITARQPPERGGQRRRRQREIVPLLGQPPTRATNRGRTSVIAPELCGELCGGRRVGAHQHVDVGGAAELGLRSSRR